MMRYMTQEAIFLHYFILSQLNIWTSKQEMWQTLDSLDQQLSLLYRNMGQADNSRPNVDKVKKALHGTIHAMEMAYGTTGSLFRAGSRQTFFASQVVRFADIYASSLLNLLYYPTFFMFRSPPMLLPHESTVPHTIPSLGGLGEAQGEMRGTSRLVESGQEPASTHDMDDDEIDLTEEVETSSDQSN